MPPCSFSSQALPSVMARKRSSRISVSPAIANAPSPSVVKEKPRPAAVASARADAGLFLVPVGEFDGELGDQDHGDGGEDNGDVGVHAATRLTAEPGQ